MFWAPPPPEAISGVAEWFQVALSLREENSEVRGELEMRDFLPLLSC